MYTFIRGNKVQNAYENGCVGAIIYSDPVDVAPEGTDSANVYPNKQWLPGTGMQRGSLKLVKGDPETPSWPSIPNVYRYYFQAILSKHRKFAKEENCL
jgi:N-acetylated-alpha-linked acidic dipeptidase